MTGLLNEKIFFKFFFITIDPYSDRVSRIFDRINNIQVF